MFYHLVLPLFHLVSPDSSQCLLAPWLIPPLPFPRNPTYISCLVIDWSTFYYTDHSKYPSYSVQISHNTKAQRNYLWSFVMYETLHIYLLEEISRHHKQSICLTLICHRLYELKCHLDKNQSFQSCKSLTAFCRVTCNDSNLK